MKAASIVRFFAHLTVGSAFLILPAEGAAIQQHFGLLVTLVVQCLVEGREEFVFQGLPANFAVMDILGPYVIKTRTRCVLIPHSLNDHLLSAMFCRLVVWQTNILARASYLLK